MSELNTVDRWIEALQILAGDADNPTDEQRAEMTAVRRKMLDTYAHGLAERIRGWAAVQVGGEIEEIYGYAADLIDPEAEDYERPAGPDEEPTSRP